MLPTGPTFLCTGALLSMAGTERAHAVLYPNKPSCTACLDGHAGCKCNQGLSVVVQYTSSNHCIERTIGSVQCTCNLKPLSQCAAKRSFLPTGACLQLPCCRTALHRAQSVHLSEHQRSQVITHIYTLPAEQYPCIEPPAVTPWYSLPVFLFQGIYTIERQA